MKILITGASGLLGKYLLKTQPLQDSPEGTVLPKHSVYPCYRNNPIKGGIFLDVSNFEKTLPVLFDLNPDVIIHCAANGDVDSVERDPSRAIKSDLTGTLHLKDYAEKMGCKLITISTNAVYNGEDPPYWSGDPHSPINFYGKIKSLADEIIMKSTCDWLIIRPIFLYGWNYLHGRENWATKIIRMLKEGKPIKLVTDSFTQPTYVLDVADFIWKQLDETQKQFNVSSGHKINLYDFGLMIKEVFGLEGEIEPAKLSDFNIAIRPTDTSFEIINNNFHQIKEGLEKMRDEQA